MSPVRTPSDISLRKSLEEAAAIVYDKPLVIELAQQGAGPAMLFRKACPGVPIVGIGPGSTASAHMRQMKICIWNIIKKLSK